MNFLTRLFDSINPAVPVIGCQLPVPKIRAAAPKQPTPPDAYIENAETVTFGFRTATAINQQDGAVDYLTDYDVEELKTRGLWGQELTVRGHKNKRGIETNTANAKAKAAWFRGGNANEISKAVGLGDSWSEKRHGAFEAALRIEVGEKQ